MKDKFISSLAFLTKNSKENLNLVIYAILKDESMYMLDIQREDSAFLIELFQDSLKKILSKPELDVVSYSRADARANCIYKYDLELSAGLKKYVGLKNADKIERFDPSQTDFSTINALVITISDNEHYVSLYKKMYPIEVLREKKGLLLSWTNRLERITKPILRISDSFHMIHVCHEDDENRDEIYVLDLNLLEKAFDIKDIIVRSAQEGIKVIKGLDVLDDDNALDGLENDITIARKLVKIYRTSPVITKGIVAKQIIDFTKKYSGITFKYNKGETKIILKTQKDKKMFLKLLNDDYLTSLLTELNYDSIAKDSL